MRDSGASAECRPRRAGVGPAAAETRRRPCCSHPSPAPPTAHAAASRDDGISRCPPNPHVSGAEHESHHPVHVGVRQQPLSDGYRLESGALLNRFRAIESEFSSGTTFVKIGRLVLTFVYTYHMSQTPPGVLGEVLRRAREALNRSPEQVGALVGISGRTVRRLEAGDAERPRRVTLEALAGFYGLNPDVIVELAEVGPEEELLPRLRRRVEEAIGPGVVAALEDVEDEEVELAMRLARLSGTRADSLSPERGRAQFVISFLRSAGERAHVTTPRP